MSEPLSPPRAEPVRYERNFIFLAVCELRIPTLLELATGSPSHFIRAVRHQFPNYEKATDLNFTPGSVATGAHHRFLSRNRRWRVSFKPSSITIETDKYSSFEEFLERILFIAASAEKTIDSDFFTRVGIRYLNTIPVERESSAGWLNPSLLGPLQAEVFGRPDHYWQEIRGKTMKGGYSMRHGWVSEVAQLPPGYILDLDFYSEDVEVSQLNELIVELHRDSFAMFTWSLGDIARSHLGKATRK